MTSEHVVVPIIIGVILVMVVVLLVACKCIEEKNREKEFKRLQDEFDAKLSQMQESHTSSFGSETNLYPQTPNSKAKSRKGYRDLDESDEEEK